MKVNARKMWNRASWRKQFMIRDLGANVGLVFASIAFTLLLLEVLVRVYAGLTNFDLPSTAEQFRERSNRSERFDAIMGWSLRPGYRSADGEIAINSMGMRSSVEPAAATLRDCTRKILVLGDSMVFGLGVEQRHIFTEILNDEELESIFLNTGVVGYSTGQEYLVQQKISDEIRFDLGILFFTQANDIWWNTRTTNFNAGFTIREGILISIPPKQFHEVPFYFRSALYRLLDLKVFKGKDGNYLLRRLEFELEGRDSLSWQVTEALLNEIKNTAEMHGYPMVVVDVPTGTRFESARVGRERQALLRDTAAQLNMDYFNLLDYYPESADSLFLEDGSHWNESGHRFIADFVKSILPPHKCITQNKGQSRALRFRQSPH